MAVRERALNTVSYISGGGTSLIDLPRDSVYHLLQLSCFAGTLTTVTSAGTAGPTLQEGFPFNLIRNMRLIRNGSDVVWQGSGAQLAKEHYYLNNRHPHARIYTAASNVETLRTATVRGVTVPANSNGIGANIAGFTGVGATTPGDVVYFDAQVELWLQMGNTGDAALNTLVDARKLATYQLEITWAAESSIMIAGANESSKVVAASFQVLSIDQDSLPVDIDFGTFKRSGQQYANLAYNSNNQQILLPRGNFFHGIIFSTQALKSTSTTIYRPENNVLGTIDNRINSNFSLRKTDFRQMQAKNVSNNGGRADVFSGSEGYPQGWAMMEYTSACETAGEMVSTFSFDQFDLLVNVQAIGSSTNGVTTASTNPLIDLFYQEVIPGVSVNRASPQGAFAGSMAKTSAKIGVK